MGAVEGGAAVEAGRREELGVLTSFENGFSQVIYVKQLSWTWRILYF